MVKHKNDPKNAMILSKDGKIMDKMTVRATVKTRTAIRRNFCSFSPGWPCPGAFTPQRTSKVATKGRALLLLAGVVFQFGVARVQLGSTHFNGTLVSGMMAMNIIIQIDMAFGYSSKLRMLAVTSSWTLSPNISHPMMAMEQSSENCFY